MTETARKRGEKKELSGNKKFQSEYEKLTEIFKVLPENKYKVAHGLIIEAARLRVYLSELWADIEKNGTTESFSQSPNTPPYQRERPQARLYVSAEKNYLAITKQLISMLPADVRQTNGIEQQLNALMEKAEG